MYRFTYSLLLTLLFASLVSAQTTVSFQNGTDSYFDTEDSYVHESFPKDNFSFSSVLKADGADSKPEGEVASLIKWDISSIPAGVTVTSASITFEFYNSSTGDYRLHEHKTAWAENSVTWESFEPGVTTLGTIPPGTIGIVEIPLNTAGIALVQKWVDNAASNYGIAIRVAGANFDFGVSRDGIAMRSSEARAFRPKLEISYTTGGSGDLQARVEFLEAQVNALTALLSGAKRVDDDLYLDGMNVHVRNGLRSTNGNQGSGPLVNGLGNLIVGYNERRTFNSDKTGSHNLVVGPEHNYSSYGGILGGIKNSTSGAYSSVSGGRSGYASGYASSISGGDRNRASGDESSISGGWTNEARGDASSVSGGQQNDANGDVSSISGGAAGFVSGNDDWLAGTLFEDH